MPIVKAGSEFLVNQTTMGDQYNSAIATDANGDFVIVWNSPFVDSDGSGIAARQFRANGTPKGGEITNINSITFGSQFASAVAVDPQGNFVVSWTTDLGSFQDRSRDISARRFAADGSYIDIGERLGVNTYTLSSQDSSRIAMNASGDYVITWQSLDQDGDSWGVYAQRFDASGNPQGDEIPVNSFTEGLQGVANVAIHNDGSFVVVWQSRGQDGNAGSSGVYIQRFDASGSPLGQEFRAFNTETWQSDPAIAMQPNGDFVVTWRGAYAGGDYSIFARRFSANGQPLSDEILVNTYTLNSQAEPAIAADEFGNFVITWESESRENEGQDSSDGVYARRFRADGTPLSNEFQVNTFTDGDQSNAAIAMQPGGDFVITWNSFGQDGDSGGVYAQRFELASTVVFKDSSIRIGESGEQARIILNRQNELQLTTQVQLDVIGGTATRGQDYAFAAPRTITFNPGETRKVINIPIRQDNLIEGNETIQLSLEAVGRAALNRRTTITATIADDDDVPRFPGSGGKKLVVGLNQAERLAGTGADEMLIGMQGNDRIVAGGGNDILIGVDPNSRTPGRSETEMMTGNAGRDLFVLGNERYAFYNSGNRNNPGLKDYAVIKDFNRQQDKMLLHGQASDYYLGASPKGTPNGAAIFLEAGKTDELIAIAQGQTQNLDLNSNAFQFVG